MFCFIPHLTHVGLPISNLESASFKQTICMISASLVPRPSPEGPGYEARYQLDPKATQDINITTEYVGEGEGSLECPPH